MTLFDRRYMKRIKQEFPESSVEVNNNVITIYGYDDYSIIEIHLHKSSWPFYPPKNLYINGVSIKSYDRIPYTLMQRYRTIYSECPCCTSYICGQNWKVTRSFKDIILQYKEMRRKMTSLHYEKWIHHFVPTMIPVELHSTICSYL